RRLLFLLPIWPPQASPLFPYTTLFRSWEAGQRGAHLVQAFLDALGDGDLAFAGQELDRAHLAHVHAHRVGGAAALAIERGQGGRSEEHTSELQSRENLVCRRLLAKKNS